MAMKKKKRASSIITQEDLNTAVIEFINRGGRIKKIDISEMASEVLEKGFAELDDDYFLYDKAEQRSSRLDKILSQDQSDI